MIIWVVAVGEPLPTDAGAPRLLRAGQIAELLANAGHEVTWWTSTFDHMGKRQRASATSSIQLAANLKMTMLHGCDYSSNVSVKRILNHHQVAKQFKYHAAKAASPDAIICSYPTLELAEAAVKFGAMRRCVVLIDIRDLWPDFLMEAFPVRLKPIGRVLLHPMYRQAQRALKGATAIVGITQPILDWALRKAGRAQRPADFVAPLAYTNRAQNEGDLSAARTKWASIGVGNSGKFVVALFATIGRLFDLTTVISAARQLKGQNFQFILAGTGDMFDYYKDMAKELDNVVFPGWIDAPAIASLMELADVGLAPYVNEHSFTLSLPNKSIEYLAGGLPIVTCLQGALSSLVEQNEVGLVYTSGDSESLANRLIFLSQNSETLKRMSTNAVKLYKDRFVAENVYANYVKNVVNLVSTNQTTP